MIACDIYTFLWALSYHLSLDYEKALDYILKEYGSMNFYMFHGGTNFGFMNGANEQTENDQLQDGQDYLADVTSYGQCLYFINYSSHFVNRNLANTNVSTLKQHRR